MGRKDGFVLHQPLDAAQGQIAVLEEEKSLAGSLCHLHVHHVGTEQFHLVAAVLVQPVKIPDGRAVTHLLVGDVGHVIVGEIFPLRILA